MLRKIISGVFGRFYLAHKAARGESLVGLLVAVGVVTISIGAVLGAVQYANQVIKIREQNIERIKIRQWLLREVECPQTLGLLGPDCPAGQEVIGARMGGATPSRTLTVTLAPYVVQENHQIRLICNGGVAPVQLRPQARPVGTTAWLDLLEPPYLICEYGPGVYAYMQSVVWP